MPVLAMFRQWKENQGGEMLSHPVLWKVTRRVDSRGSVVIPCTFMPSVPTSAFPSLLSFVPSECPILSNSCPKDCFYRNPIQNVGLVNKLLRRNREGYSLTDKSTSTWPQRIERFTLLSSWGGMVYSKPALERAEKAIKAGSAQIEYWKFRFKAMAIDRKTRFTPGNLLHPPLSYFHYSFLAQATGAHCPVSFSGFCLL